MLKSTSRNKSPELAPPPYDFEQTLRWLAHVKTDEWWQSQMPFSHLTLACVLEVSSRYVKLILSGRPTHPPYRMLERISRLIPDIERRALVFPNNPRGWVRVKRPPRFLRLDPPGECPKIPKLALEAAWSLWARCASCGNNKFMPVILNDKPHVACYHCMPPAHAKQLGARPAGKSLIHEALKSFY